jgi:hypothetical protein
MELSFSLKTVILNLTIYWKTNVRMSEVENERNRRGLLQVPWS